MRTHAGPAVEKYNYFNFFSFWSVVQTLRKLMFKLFKFKINSKKEEKSEKCVLHQQTPGSWAEHYMESPWHLNSIHTLFSLFLVHQCSGNSSSVLMCVQYEQWK